jgi:hypothetical protein
MIAWDLFVQAVRACAVCVSCGSVVPAVFGVVSAALCCLGSGHPTHASLMYALQARWLPLEPRVFRFREVGLLPNVLAMTALFAEGDPEGALAAGGVRCDVPSTLSPAHSFPIFTPECVPLGVPGRWVRVWMSARWRGRAA